MSAGVSIVPSGVPSAFQSRIVRALSPLASWAPSPRQAADSTSPVWPVRSLTAVPAARSQSLTGLPDAAAACLPSGLTARAWTPAGMVGEVLVADRRRDLPDLRRLVEAPREDPLAVRRRATARTRFAVPLEPLDLLAGGGIPEPHRVVEPAGDQRLAVRAPGDRIDRVGMAVERSDHRSRLLRQGDTRGRHGADKAVTTTRERIRRGRNMMIARFEGRRRSPPLIAPAGRKKRSGSKSGGGDGCGVVLFSDSR